MARQTSINTYNDIKSGGYLSRTRWEAYDILFHHGPLTASELYAKAKEAQANTSLRDHLQPRLTEMREMGCVKENGTVVCSVTGRNVIQWDVTDLLPIKPEKRITPKSQKKALVEKITRLVESVEPKWQEPLREIYAMANSI